MSDALGRSIQLYLVDGRPSGLRKATLHGWTGVVLVSGNSTFGALTAREEADRAGIYVLHGPDAEGDGARSYIGSANTVRERIKQSGEKRGFWETAFAVTTSDDDLSKGHVEYLEARLIQMATAAGRTTLDNGTAPDADRRRLPEADRANMEQFLLNLEMILPVVGLDIFKPRPKAVKENEPAAAPSDQTVFEIQHKSGVFAEAVEEDGDFVVRKGSEALKGTNQVLDPSYARLKSRLIADQILDGSGDKWSFAESYAFSSPSAASCIVLDRSSNGRTAWRVKGSKQTYHDHQQALETA